MSISSLIIENIHIGTAVELLDFFGRGLNRLTPFFYYTHYPPPPRTNLGFGTKGQSTNPSVRSRHTLGRRWWLTKSLWSQKIVFYMYCDISEHNPRGSVCKASGCDVISTVTSQSGLGRSAATNKYFRAYVNVMQELGAQSDSHM